MPTPTDRRPEIEQDFSAVSLTVASPEQILSWSRGEIQKPETINYRTQKPELDGLFCERIFGPTKNYECYCGKYKRIRYKGIVCEKCGVEVTHSVVRRERMGHIDLAVPVCHTWFTRSVPSRIGLLLDMSVKPLEQVVYFASYLTLEVDDAAREESLAELKKEFEALTTSAKKKAKEETAALRAALKKGKGSAEALDETEARFAEEMDGITEAYSRAKKELEGLRVGGVLSELEYREANMKFGHVFRASTGAEAVRELLSRIDMASEVEQLQSQLFEVTGQKQKKILKRMRFLNALLRADIRPEWLILTRLPILPPDLRPMVQLDGGRFAASDLNDLYRRIINRNTRLKRLLAIGAPEVITRNEKRMLQESVDTLLNNSPRAGKTVFTSGDRRKLRSLSDMLKGKQGRFRQNLLGKRVDYSGRSVIVVGPKLKLHQCGLPKQMAMRLFKPFVIGELIARDLAHNGRSAERYIAAGHRVIWDILEKVTKGRYVLLNRAPTLHRLGIQAFEPVLIEGKAIQVHPLVCAAFNADFDGDQMAVHLPLSEAAQREARELMVSSQNLLKPSSGKPIISATQDMVLGCYFLTHTHPGKTGEGSVHASVAQAKRAQAAGHLDIQAMCRIRYRGQIEKTTLGRLIFQDILPEEIPFENKTFRKKDLERLLFDVVNTCSEQAAVRVADEVKDLGFEYATQSGVSIGKDDLIIPEEKTEILEEATEKVRKVSNQFWKGYITENERYIASIKIWSEAKNRITKQMVEGFQDFPENDIFYMVDSAARGNWGQITQMCGMKGLVASPSGRTIELPIRSNLKEGFSVLEYFINTHGGRKGKSDTALKTAEAGYLTRRLVDAVQDIVIREEDCGQTHDHLITREQSEEIGEAFENRIFGRVLTKSVACPKTGEVLAEAGSHVDHELVDEISAKGISEVHVRGIMTCRTAGGICQKCYGFDLGSNQPVEIGTPVGIIAAQSIGEPGTQLTMRTFHMGGVAGEGDITQGLSRVEELFEARTPRTAALLAEISGTVRIQHEDDHLVLHIVADQMGTDVYPLEFGAKVAVKEGDSVEQNQILAKASSVLRSTHAGVVKSITAEEIRVEHTENASREHQLPQSTNILVGNGDKVQAGQPLTVGHLNLRHLMELTDVHTVQRYLMMDVQKIYASQGQTISDKHIEIIVKKMFSRVEVMDPGGASGILPGDQMDLEHATALSEKLEESGQRPVRFSRLLLGLTRIALATPSWLSAASFQETIRVLVDAATTGRKDHLEGLKENVIIGKLIPAGKSYRAAHHADAPENLTDLAVDVGTD